MSCKEHLRGQNRRAYEKAKRLGLCLKCRKRKPSGGAMCPPCREYGRITRAKWLVGHKQQAARAVAQAYYRKKERRHQMLAEVVGMVCVDCGEDRPKAIEYHHPEGAPGTWKDPRRQLLNLSAVAFKDQLMYLVPLCGTCHMLRHE